VIKIEHLSKSFQKFKALDDLSLDIAEGEIFGFIGPNGAGKSTTIKVLTGLLKPTSGKASIDGIDCTKGSRELRYKVGYMPDNFGVYEGLRVWEYLDFFCAAYKIPKKERTDVIDNVLEVTSSQRIKDFYMETLSKGMKQKAGLAKTLLHDPSVVILDEPSSGLDPRARIEMRELIKKLKSMNKTVMVSSHILSELSEISDKIGILEKGVLLASGTVEEVMVEFQPDLLYELEVLGDIDRAKKVLLLMKKKGMIDRLEKVGAMFSFRILNPEDEEAAKVLNLLLKNKVLVKNFRHIEADLEEVFLQVTEQHGNEDVVREVG
jgi:ABC-2 type transport system ATP-binding protein